MADHALATVSNPTSALTDFTLVVDLSTMPANWWTAVSSSDGTRGRVYKGDGSTRLAADWIDFNNTASTGLLRVKWTGSLATTGTQQLWIEPPVTGNAAVAADNTYGSDNAYDSNWLQYLPLDGDANDRTSNGTNATLNSLAFPADEITGQMGSALDLDGTANAQTFSQTGDYLVADDSSSPFLGDDSVTAMAWVKPTSQSQSDEDTILASFNNNARGEILWRYDSQNNEIDIYAYDTALRGASNGVSIEGAWHHVALHLSSGTLTLYVDGVSQANTVTSLGSMAPYGGSDNLIWGGTPHASDGWLGGLDELQLHTAARSADWIDHEYDQTNDQATFYGTWSWETGTSSTDALTGSDLTGGTPTLDTPTIGQTHALTGSELTSSAPTLDTPTLGQVHALTGTEITGGTPLLDTPTLAEGTDNLTGADLTGAAPLLDTPTIGQTHGLTGVEITSGTPTLDSPTIGQVHALTGTDLLGGTPTLDTPSLTAAADVDALTSSDLTGGTPTLDAPTIGQVHSLTGVDILGGVSLDSPTLGQVHALTGTEITGGTPTLGTPSLSDYLFIFSEHFTANSAMTTIKTGSSAMTTEYAATSAID